MVINRVLVLVLGFVSIVIFSDCIFLCLAQNGTRPATVNVGALVAYNTTIGRVAKKAIELALEDINNDETLLNGTRLVLTMMDSNCSAFIGTSAALELMKKKNMAILGPQSSVIAHVVSNIASELQVPIMSFGATDPTLSSYQYPYFLRMTHSDIYEMEAVAAVIGFYGWRHIVVMYIDDDYGRNGIAALSDALETVRAKIVNKVAFAPGVSNNEIGSVLVQLALMESRVFVVHMNPDAGMNLFSEALNLGMLSSSYVWIATDWLSSLLDSNLPDYETMNSLQGVIALRPYVPISVREHAFTVGWNNLFKARSVDVHLNAFGLYAYDATWAIAYSIDNFFSKGGNNSFKNYPQLSNASGSQTQLAKLKVFTGGPELQKILLQSNFTGLTGPVKFGKNGDLLASSFEIINIIGTGFRKVSYWTNHSGLSAIPPQNRVAKSHAQHIVDQKMRDIIWPGESKLVPRGWVFPNNVNLLPYPVPYTFVSFGNGKSSPNYDELMQQLASKNFDAVVGDITIVTNRAKIVDFTQPYIDSGLAIVTSLHEANPSGTWAFLQPFTLEMWCATFAFFLIMGAVVWSLEHKSNPDFRGNPKKQAMTILWFSFSTMFFVHRENIVSALGRAVLLIWLFVVLIINSSYTASLTSTLTVRQLSPTISGIESLTQSNEPIGYQAGAYVGNYLSEVLNIDKSRLVPLDSAASYAKALSQGPKNGGVGAIIDELPVIQLFLSTECSFRTVGLEFTKGGWGFAFPKESPLAIDMSTAILTLSESGELQRIHDKWLSRNRCGSQETQIDASQLQLKSFWGLFLITGVVSFTAFVVFLGCKIFQFIQHFRHTNARDGPLLTSSSLMSRILHRLQLFAKFIDEKEIVDKKEGSAPISERCETEFLT
ncbi:glutamate receptor 3.4 isoform X2 [Cryptomeria japonica]|uniref:glutamate receptor 3.4 isoform X2 n=1 Tax=Cryptomeria japonica TaxID=3369 RepID=UPI0027DA735C|nr:glutamate receptor 3.4 isoform X2 [Cryptomeria japonica]